MKVFRYIRKYLTSNGTENEPKIIDETRKMFQACMNTGKVTASFVYTIECMRINRQLDSF